METMPWIIGYLALLLYCTQIQGLFYDSQVAGCHQCQPQALCVFLGEYGYQCLCAKGDDETRAACKKTLGAYIANRRRNPNHPNPSPRSNIHPYNPLLPQAHDLSQYTNNPALPYPYPSKQTLGRSDINKKTSISNLPYPPTLAPTVYTRYPGLPYPYPTGSGLTPPKLPYPYPTQNNGYTNNPSLPYPYPTSSAYTNNPNLPYPYQTLNPTSIIHTFTNDPHLPTPYPPSQDSTLSGKPTATSGNSLHPDVTPSKDAILDKEDCAVVSSENTCSVADTSLDLPAYCGSLPIQIQRCNGSCGPNCQNAQDLCCETLTYHNDVISCADSVTVDQMVVDACTCALCAKLATILKGRVRAMDRSTPLKLGAVTRGDVPIAKTDYQGHFAVSLERDVKRIGIGFDDPNDRGFAKTAVDFDVDLKSDFLSMEFHIPETEVIDNGYVMNPSMYLPQPAKVASVPVSEIPETFGSIRDRNLTPISVCAVVHVDMVEGETISMDSNRCPDSNSVWRQTGNGTWETVDLTESAGNFTWLHSNQKEWYVVGSPVTNMCCLSIDIQDSSLTRAFPYVITITSSDNATTTHVIDSSRLLMAPCGKATLFVKRLGYGNETDASKESMDIQLKDTSCDNAIDASLLLEEEEGRAYRYNLETSPHSLTVHNETDSMTAWHPLAYKDIYSTCMVAVMIQCTGNEDVVAISTSGTNSETEGRVYGITEKKAKKDERMCLEYRCSGMSLTETELEFTRLTVMTKGSNKCKLVEINDKLAERFSNIGILLEYFTALMPVDAYGETYGVFQGNSRFSAIDSYITALNECKAARGRYAVAFGTDKKDVEIVGQEDIEFD